jgi:alcohol dehydrogenase (cytochrome c)
MGCHGEDGRGGEHGPAIAGVPRPRADSKAAVLNLIHQGIPDRGMPAFRLSGEEANAIADYVLSLKARAKPNQAENAAKASITVRLRDGRTIHGVVKNESNFDLQLLGDDGKLYLLTKEQPAAVSASNGVSWPTYDGNLSGNRFSPLDQIQASNVNRLAPKWMFTLPGVRRALQVTPVVVDGVMYVASVNEAYALDARSGREIWHYSRTRSEHLAGDAAGGINRGVAVLGERVFMVTDNAHLLALDRNTGQLLWDVQMADSAENYGSTSAPLVVNDLVVAGTSGGDEGVRGFLSAYKASTGERVWRFWTIPARGEPGSETWGGRALEHGCGSAWFTGTYDPEARLLYWPTGNPCPDYNGDERKGDNLYTASVVALDPDSGRLKWYYQFTPHDVHDWDAAETPMLVDAEFHGKPRKLLLQANRNGFFYVLDRLTGKVLLAEPFLKKITWASGIGPDGRPQLLPGNEPTEEGQLTCPSVAGAANWPSSAYDPASGLFYVFAEESCNIYTKNDEWWQAGKSFYGGGTRHAPGGPDSGKYLRAINIQTGKIAWEIPGVGGGILASGLMATAGGLIFYGDGYGAFVAADARNGKPLWHFNTNQNFKAGPMTYMVDNVQYIGMAAGPTILAFTLR